VGNVGENEWLVAGFMVAKSDRETVLYFDSVTEKLCGVVIQFLEISTKYDRGIFVGSGEAPPYRGNLRKSRRLLFSKNGIHR
jgi:hypothetical protein